MKPIVVIESPYAGDVEKNLTYARACLKDSLLRGEAPVASHLLYTQPGVLDDLVPGEREMGIAAGIEFLRVCETHAFYVDLGWSPGMKAAYEIARAIPGNNRIEIRTIYNEKTKTK